MRRGFIKQVTSAQKVQQLIEQLVAADVELSAIIIASNFENIYPSINKGDTIVAINYASISNSMNSFFDTIEEAVQRGLTIESIEEADVKINAKTAPVFRVIYELSYELRKTSTMEGLDKARAEGKILGRPAGTRKVTAKVRKVDELRQTSEVSIAEACRIANCLPRTYYRLKKIK